MIFRIERIKDNTNAPCVKAYKGTYKSKNPAFGNPSLPDEHEFFEFSAWLIELTGAKPMS